MSGKLVSVPPRRSPETAEEMERRRAEGLAELGNFIGKLQARGYFGKVTITMQNGVIGQYLIEQVLKSGELG